MNIIEKGPFSLGEGIIWDTRIQLLYWIDIVNGCFYAKAPDGNTRKYLLPGLPGTLVLTNDPDEVLIPTDAGLLRVSRITGKHHKLADFPEDSSTSRFNDGKCDPNGNLWVGTMEKKGNPGIGTLYRIDKNFSIEPVVHNLTVPNGICWNRDHSTLYHIDSPSRAVTAYDFDKNQSTIDNPRTVISIPDGWGFPDGMTIDDADHLWIAHWDGSSIVCYDPASGKVINKYNLPAPKITSCCFGGEQMNTLYISSALGSADGGQCDPEQYPHSGSIFAIETQAHGLPPFLFNL